MRLLYSYFALALLILNIHINENLALSLSIESKDKTLKYSTVSRKKDNPIISKCCGLKEYTKKKGCLLGISYDYSDIPVYDESLQVIDKEIPEVFRLIPGSFRSKVFLDYSVSAQSAGFLTYLTKDGFLHLELPNAFDRWKVLNNSQFCVEHRLKRKSKTDLIPVFYIILPNERHDKSNIYMTSAIYISCVFLLLVLLVYSLLKELRNLGGKILMAYVASLFTAFLLLAIIQIPDHEVKVCQCLTYTIYFAFLATFCWMNVMSYDIWWTFRGYAKARQIHRRGENFKFIMYCLYAWGLPFGMAIAFAVLNEADLKHIPWLITPKIPRKGCFLEGGEKFLYLYVPMLILIVCNWLFYLMTAYNLWRLSRGTAVLDSAAAGTPAAHRSHHQRFMVYLKLSIVMGLNWVLEVVSFIYPGLKVWYLSDAYNVFIGLAIFLIFCCKRIILKKLMKLFRRHKKSKWTPSSKSCSSSSSDSTASQETSLPLVCSNPKGPAYPMKLQ